MLDFSLKGETELLVDWDNPPSLHCPRRKVVLDLSSRERLALLKAKRRKHKPGKAHSTNGERSREMKAKAARIRKRIAKNNEAHAAYVVLARAYWAGEIAEHP